MAWRAAEPDPEPEPEPQRREPSPVAAAENGEVRRLRRRRRRRRRRGRARACGALLPAPIRLGLSPPPLPRRPPARARRFPAAAPCRPPQPSSALPCHPGRRRRQESCRHHLERAYSASKPAARKLELLGHGNGCGRAAFSPSCGGRGRAAGRGAELCRSP
jgi:hypothetical protein